MVGKEIHSGAKEEMRDEMESENARGKKYLAKESKRSVGGKC